MADIVLDPYQVTAVDWLLERNNRILADEPGVGKSYPAIEVAVRRRGPALFVVPAYLIPQWAMYIRSYTKVKPAVIYGTQKERAQGLRESRDAQFTITSYNTAAQRRKASNGMMRISYEDQLFLPRGKWATVVCDEAHRMKNRKSNIFVHAQGWRSPATHIKLLTGTPIYSSPADLWALLNLCDPQTFRGYWPFVSMLCHVEETPWAHKVRGLKDPEAFQEIIAPYMLRRTLHDVGLDVRDAINIPLPVEMPPSERKAHKRARLTYSLGEAHADGAGAMMVMLRKHTAPFKITAALELINDRFEEQPVIVFSWYRETRDRFASTLREQGKRPVFLCDSDQTPQERNAALEEWRKTPNGVVVGTIAGLGEGANLQHASVVVMIEQDWVEASNEQAIARARRRGQKSTVRVYRLVCEGTVDVDIYRAASERREVSQAALIKGDG